jgi:hypothetical protein
MSPYLNARAFAFGEKKPHPQAFYLMKPVLVSLYVFTLGAKEDSSVEFPNTILTI